jgi:hypothetical protein
MTLRGASATDAYLRATRFLCLVLLCSPFSGRCRWASVLETVEIETTESEMPNRSLISKIMPCFESARCRNGRGGKRRSAGVHVLKSQLKSTYLARCRQTVAHAKRRRRQTPYRETGDYLRQDSEQFIPRLSHQLHKPRGGACSPEPASRAAAGGLRLAGGHTASFAGFSVDCWLWTSSGGLGKRRLLIRIRRAISRWSQTPGAKRKGTVQWRLGLLVFMLAEYNEAIPHSLLNGHTLDDACGSKGPQTHRNGTARRSPFVPGTAPSPWDSCMNTRAFCPADDHAGSARISTAQTVFELTMILRREKWGPCGASGRGTMAPIDALLASAPSTCRLDGTVLCLCPTSTD